MSFDRNIGRWFGAATPLQFPMLLRQTPKGRPWPPFCFYYTQTCHFVQTEVPYEPRCQYPRPSPANAMREAEAERAIGERAVVHPAVVFLPSRLVGVLAEVARRHAVMLAGYHATQA